MRPSGPLARRAQRGMLTLASDSLRKGDSMPGKGYQVRTQGVIVGVVGLSGTVLNTGLVYVFVRPAALAAPGRVGAGQPLPDPHVQRGTPPLSGCRTVPTRRRTAAARGGSVGLRAPEDPCPRPRAPAARACARGAGDSSPCPAGSPSTAPCPHTRAPPHRRATRLRGSAPAMFRGPPRDPGPSTPATGRSRHWGLVPCRLCRRGCPPPPRQDSASGDHVVRVDRRPRTGTAQS